MMRTQREMKGQRSDMNLRAVEQERELKRQRTSKACGKQSSYCSNGLQSANYFDRRRGKSKQREWGGLLFWSVGRSIRNFYLRMNALASHFVILGRFLEKYPLERWIIWRFWSWAHRFAYNCLQFDTSHGHQHGGSLICISLWRQLKTKNSAVANHKLKNPYLRTT